MLKATAFYEGCGREGLIRCIFLSEFHPVVGSKISCQVPDNYVSKEIFDAVNVYIIPKPQLQRSILTINALGYKVIGYPVRIDSQRYARNAFHFNLCFVCDAWSRSMQYEPVVKKLAEYLILMEEESGILSQDDDSRMELQRLLAKILSDLNEKRVVSIVEGHTAIYLKIIAHRDDPPNGANHMVPFLFTEFKDIAKVDWDLTTQQITPFIDGISHISKIAAKADVELTLVKSCIQNLAYFKAIQLLPILKYSNVYMCTRKIQDLVKNSSVYNACKKYVCLNPEKPRPSLRKVFQIYASMTHGITLKSLCQRLLPQMANIDIRKLVIFGLQNNFIRCIHKYPIFIGSIPTGRQKLYTGILNFDEISEMTGLSPSAIENDIDCDTNVKVIWR